MLRRIAFITTGIITLLTVLPANAATDPVIRNVQGRYILVLPAAMQKALSRYDRSFTPWRVNDYLPSIQKSYKFTNHQAPFAVIGDINGDKRQDIVVQGHTAKADILLCVLARRRGYRIIEISRSDLSHPRTDWYGFGDHKEYGLFSYLIYTPPGRIKSPHEAIPLRLKTDAFQTVAYEKAAVLYYWQNGKFHEYIIAD